MESKTRLTVFFSQLDLGATAMKLGKQSSRGPAIVHLREAMLRAFMAGKLEGIPTVVKLVNRLKSDMQFRYQCGFHMNVRVPSTSTFSRLFTRLASQDLLQELFEELLRTCAKMEMVSFDSIAIDSTKLSAYEKVIPKKYITSDEDANWGSKSDTHGNQITWFGYKVHLAVDTKSELPIAVSVTPANVYDSTRGIPMMEETIRTATLLETKPPQLYLMDSGYDAKDIYQYALDHDAVALIPLNHRKAKEGPEGFTFEGTPICSAGFTMTYWGYDKKTETKKFRCPHVTGHVECPFGSVWCSDSSYGMVVKVHIKDNPRIHSPIHRDSDRWKKEYKARTSVERVNARLKEHLGLEKNLRVRGIQKVKAHVLLCCIVLIAGTLGVNTVRTNKAAA